MCIICNLFSDFLRVHSCENEQELADIIVDGTNISIGEVWMGVVFLNTNDTTMYPTKLDYKIRIIDSFFDFFHNDDLYYDEPQPGPCKKGNLICGTNSFNQIIFHSIKVILFSFIFIKFVIYQCFTR